MRNERDGDRTHETFGALQEAVLELMLTGAPDKAIAARLSVTERTVQRRVRTLIVTVGVENRMQLGAFASRRGMVVPGGGRRCPDETDLLLLKVLMAGGSERSAAVDLEIGYRTVQRRVRRLMELVGAANRVQLGWHAEHNGWV